MGAILAHHALLLTANGGGDPTALSIYNKLVEWWTCDALSGGNLVGQHASNSLVGTNNGGSVSVVSAKVGNGVSLTPNYGFLGPNTNWSSVWPSTTTPTALAVNFKPNAFAANQFVCNLRVGTTVSGAGQRLLLYVDTSGALHAFAGDGTTFVDAGATATTLTSGTFGFLQGEVAPGVTNGLRARINNGTWKTATPLSTSPSTTGTLGVRAGFDATDTNGSPTGYCNGVIDELALFKNTLSDTEWNYLYNGGASMSYAALKAAAGF